MSFTELFLYKIYSFLFCLRYLPLSQAVHIPILIHPSVKIDKLPRGAIKFNGKLKHSMLIFGFKGTTGTSNCRSLISIRKGGSLVVSDDVTMARGTRVIISDKGTMTIGKQFCCNGDCFFNCTTKINIGNDIICGWNNSFNTTDGHHVYDNGKQKPMEGDIEIGNHVWIASHCIIGKYTYVATNSVVAQNSLLSRRYETPGSLIAGIPAKTIKTNYSWTGI